MRAREREQRPQLASQALRPLEKTLARRGEGSSRACSDGCPLDHRFEAIGIGPAPPDHGVCLDPAMRPRLESFFGADLGDVRLHTDEQADALAQHYGARAFTSGRDIFFRSGAYAPHSREGRATMTHEMAHVIQQSERSLDLDSSPAKGDPDDAFEATARLAASWLDAGVPTLGALNLTPGAAAPAIQCQEYDEETCYDDQRYCDDEMCYDVLPGGFPPFDPYGPTIPDPYGPTDIPPTDPKNLRIPPAPRVPRIPTPPEGGFPKPPPTPASPYGGGGFWGTVGSVLGGIGSTLVDIFPPVPRWILYPDGEPPQA